MYEMMGIARDAQNPTSLAYVTLRFGENKIYVFVDVTDGITPYVVLDGDDLKKFIPIRRKEGTTSSFRMKFGEYTFDDTLFIYSAEWISFNPNREKGYRIENMAGDSRNCRFDLVLDVERITFIVHDGKIEHAFHNGECVLD
jgi:hypothetical protein